ncbi:MAG: hypothetical protein KME42_00260 [Tildeniella nuda ZEHNDER 1965/U140]|jgi:hypothetical protein|nr:hypothetical protein [Tildeniella nuda ZEHNDER 1965/U140]
MKLEVSQPQRLHPRLDAFRKRFSEAHLHLAYHAALPLALTPDLMYRLWANFQQDTQGEMLNIPWVAVADVLLSSLCEEVGHELYEMDREVRTELLSQLQQDSRFGQVRIQQLSDFLLTYVQQQLDSPDIDVRDRAEAQRWAAIAYTQPGAAAQELSQMLSKTYLHDKTECLRIAAIVETLADPLVEFEPLLADARTKANAVRSGVTDSVPTPPKSRKRLYWAIGITVVAFLAVFAYRYISVPKPSPTPSPYPERSPSTALPLPSGNPTVPAAAPLPAATSTPEPSATPQQADVPERPAKATIVDIPPTPTPIATDLPAPAPVSPSTPPPAPSNSLPSPSPTPPEPSPSPSSDAQCLTYKCTDVTDPGTSGGASR